MTISVIVPTYNRSDLLMGRCIPSVLAQSYTDWECLVVGDGTEQATVDAMASFGDPRFRFWNLPRAELPDDPAERWALAGTGPINFGLDHARGEYVSILCDDDEFLPNNLATLVYWADKHDADFVYGQSATPHAHLFGGPKPHPLDIPQGTYILRASLGYRADPTSGQPWDGEFLGRILDGGHRVVFVPRLVHIFHPSRESFAHSRAWQ